MLIVRRETPTHRQAQLPSRGFTHCITPSDLRHLHTAQHGLSKIALHHTSAYCARDCAWSLVRDAIAEQWVTAHKLAILSMIDPSDMSKALLE